MRVSSLVLGTNAWAELLKRFPDAITLRDDVRLIGTIRVFRSEYVPVHGVYPLPELTFRFDSYPQFVVSDPGFNLTPDRK